MCLTIKKKVKVFREFRGEFMNAEVDYDKEVERKKYE